MSSKPEPRPTGGGRAAGKKPPKREATAYSFEERYPHIAAHVGDGWIEMGWDDCNRPFVRALDIGGIVWEGKQKYASIDEALQALDDGIAEWMRENGTLPED